MIVPSYGHDAWMPMGPISAPRWQRPTTMPRLAKTRKSIRASMKIGSRYSWSIQRVSARSYCLVDQRR